MKKGIRRVIALILVLAMTCTMAFADAENEHEPLEVTGGGNFKLEAGEQMDLYASVSGGSGDYTYVWTDSGSVSLVDHMRTTATVYAGNSGSGSVYLTVYDNEDPSVNDTVVWEFSISSAKTAPNARLDKTSLKLTAGDKAYLNLSASGGSGKYEYYWKTDNENAVTIYADGSTCMVIATDTPVPGANSAQISAAVLDTETGIRSEILTCNVTVSGGSAQFSVVTATMMGITINMNDAANMIADAFRTNFGTRLNFSASVRLDNPNNRIGTLRLQDNTAVSSYASYTFASLQDMIFYPNAAGTFLTDYTITDGGMTIYGTITIDVTGGVSVQSAYLDNTKLTMETYSSQFLNLSVSPRNASYTVSWVSSNTKIAQIYGSGSSVTIVTGGATGEAEITAIVTDANGKEIRCTCKVTVGGKTDSYDPTLTIMMGSDYTGTSVSDSIATRFRDVFGFTLPGTAIIRFSSMGSSLYGTLYTANGRAVLANQDYTLTDMVYMYFVPNAAGTYILPYKLTYQNYTMSGTISVYIKAASIQVNINPDDMVLSQYSEQTINLSVSPANTYYKVRWISEDEGLVSVLGNGTNATVYSGTRTGTTAITAVVTDINGAEVRRSCKVQVTSKSNAFDPSVSTTIGLPYTGTGTSSAMRSQFYDLYGVRLDDEKAIITFSSTGNNDVAVMRLEDGTPIRAYTDYTFDQYIKMYTQPVAAGTFSVPYTLSYSGRTLKGTVSVVVKGSEISVTLKLKSGEPYLFSTDLGTGSGSTILADAIRNAVGTSWSYLRFTRYTDDTGTLYLDKNSTGLTVTTNVSAAALSGLYFKPGKLTGNFVAKFTVYNEKGGVVSSGSLTIVKTELTFTDVSASAYYASAVSWAVSKGITSGTGGTLFSPNMQVTRGQAVTFLWRAAGQPTPTLSENPFKDVRKGDYYYNAVLWAVQQGITTGTSATTFDPNNTLNNDQLLTFLCRANGGYAGGEDWSALAVSWAKDRGLLDGIPGTFKPGAACPRSDVVYFLWKNYVG